VPPEKKQSVVKPVRRSSDVFSETRENLGKMLKDAGIVLSVPQIDLLWQYHRLIREKNEEYDLTRLRSFRDFVVKHYIDCLIVTRLIELPAPLLDIGTGAGFPGIPLKIAVPGMEIILAESRAKRNEFLRLVIGQLGLKKIEVLGRGILPGRLDRKVAGVITRAVESSAETLGRVRDMLDTGGLVILMKGPGGEEEIAEALHLYGREFRLRNTIPYTLPGTTHHRRLLIFEKTAPVGARPVLSGKREITEISSSSNPSFREWKSLFSGRAIRKTGHALVSGSKTIGELLRLKPDIILAWIDFPRSAEPPADLPSDVPGYRLSRELFHELDVHGTEYPLLLVRVPLPLPFDISALPKGAVPFIAFQDPANVGAVIRSAAAFNARTIVMLREAANPYHPKSIRAAGTALFLVEFMEGPSIRDIGSAGIPIVALSVDGIDVSHFAFPERFALLPGVEGPGLPGELQTAEKVCVPISPDVESLNAAAAVSIVLYEWRRRKKQ
jgi:16S rRNA (guanine527-N7)-methyltransferase